MNYDSLTFLEKVGCQINLDIDNHFDFGVEKARNQHG